MKKILSMLLVLSMLLGCSAAMAEDLGVQVIGGPDSDTTPMSLDDIQLGKTYTVDGYAKFAPVEALFVDYFAQFNKDADYYAVRNSYNQDNVYYQEDILKGDWAYYYTQAGWMDSGLNADFFWLRIDITNAQKKTVKYLSEASVKMVYDDEYEFNGWVRQANFDYNTRVYRLNSGTAGASFAVLNPANEEGIDMMYTGTFIFGCTLPNSVVQDTKTPLRMVITIGGNEPTYNIRK